MSEDTPMFDEKETAPGPSPLENSHPSEDGASEPAQKPEKITRTRKKKGEPLVATEPEPAVIVLPPEEKNLDRFFLSLQTEDMPQNVPDFSQGINFQSPYKTLEIVNNDIAHLRETAFITLACNAGLETENKIVQIEKIYTILDEEVSARSFLVEQQTQHLKDYYSRLGGLILGTQEATEVLLADLKNEQKYRHLMESGLFYAPEIWQKFIAEGEMPMTKDMAVSPMQMLEQLQTTVEFLVQKMTEQSSAVSCQPAALVELPPSFIDLLNVNTTLLSEQAMTITLLKEQVENMATSLHQLQTERGVFGTAPLIPQPPASDTPLVESPAPSTPSYIENSNNAVVEPPEEEFPDEPENEEPPAMPLFEEGNPMAKLMQQMDHSKKKDDTNDRPASSKPAYVAALPDEDAV